MVGLQGAAGAAGDDGLPAQGLGARPFPGSVEGHATDAPSAVHLVAAGGPAPRREASVTGAHPEVPPPSAQGSGTTLPVRSRYSPGTQP